MKITFKLFAMLSDHLPEEVDGARRAGNIIELPQVAEGTTVQQLIERFKLPAKLVHLVLVDGTYVAPADRATRVLKDGEALAIWPPIAGG
ncbi:MAG: MoaD/ThiS family protein [Burkholderiales bacterium]|nr:MAG: MoaD/ThiS family protein [Burkholderiales bacterium]